MKFGVCLPSFSRDDPNYQRGPLLKEYAQRIEGLGFDGIWVFEHMLPAPPRYGVSWLSPLLMLTHAAAVTERIELGTAILIAPMRHPVMLAKEIATLDYLSRGRFVFGYGLGWLEKELVVSGCPMRERGPRTDEALEIIRKLFSQPSASHQGRFWEFEDVILDPRPAKPPQMWSGGGSRAAEPLAPGILRRIARADGWIVPGQGTADQIGARWQEVKAALQAEGRDIVTFPFANDIYFHVVDTEDREEALDLQRTVFAPVMGPQRPWEEVVDHYLTGTPTDMVRRIKRLQEIGVTYVILHPIVDDLEQLDLLKEKIVPHFR